MSHSFALSQSQESPSETVTSASIWKLLLVVMVLINVKSLPIIWHIRLLNAFRFVLRSERSKFGPTPAQLFQPIITSSHGPLAEIDINMHKSNSSYFSDLDIARTHLMCTLFSCGIEQARNSKRNGLIGGGNDSFGIALGAVSCSFRKELKPYETYEIWTRVLSWDQKWLYLVTHFVRKDAVRPRAYTLYPGQKVKKGASSKVARKEDAIIASALSKCVFKKGRLTIPPVIMMEASGLLPSRPKDITLLRTGLSTPPSKTPLLAKLIDVVFQAFESLDAIWDTIKRRYAPEVCRPTYESADEAQSSKAEEWTWEKIEEERRKGMELATLLAGLDGLDGEFTAEADALGKHSDLWWLLGITK